MNWSQKNIRKADTKDKFKFFYLETNPPPVISGKSLGSEAYNVLTTENNSSSMNMNKVIQPILNKKEKYDF